MLFRKKTFKRIWLPILALNLFPLAASGDEIVKPKGPRFNDVTASELASTFRNFEANIEGRDPNNRAILYGMVFDDCKGFFEISNSRLDATLRSSDSIGFRISDANGKGRECMTRHKSDSCGALNPCTRISQLQGANLDLSGMGDLKIQLMHVDPDRDRDQNQWEDFSDKSLAHVSATTIKTEREKEEKRRKAQVVSLLKKQVASCRKTDDDRQTAMNAADVLHGLGIMSDEQVEKLTKELNNFHLNMLGRKFLATPIKNQAELAELTEQLKAFEAEHPEAADNIAVLMYQKALAYAKTAKTPEAYDMASGMITEAQSLSGLNEIAASRLENYQRDIQVGRFQMMAQSGETDPYTFWQPYSSFMWDLQTGMRTCTGPQAKTESCRSMNQAYQSAGQIPQKAYQAQYEQYMFQMRMQQQMAQFSGGGPFGAPGSAGGSQPGSGFFRN